MANNKKAKNAQNFNLKKELKLLPGYVILSVWILFTAAILIWIFAASLSTPREINRGELFQFASGFHWENYVTAWNTQNVAVYLGNSLLYASCSVVGILLISAPAAYILARFTFLGKKLIHNGFVVAMSIPLIMIVLPLFITITKMGLGGSRILLIVLYICMNIPYTTIFLINFFSNLSRSYEEAAAIDGCSATGIFWKIMFPLAQPGLITIGIFNFLNVWNEYFLSLIFASSDRMKSVGTGLFSIVDSLNRTGQLGALFAAVIIVFMPTFIMYIFLSEKIIAGVTGGGVKG